MDQHDRFSGYTDEDISEVRALIPPDLEPASRFYTDVFGVKVSPDYCPWIAGRIGSVGTASPFPSDGYLADGIEFVALAAALKIAAEQPTFTAVECGAGWGPWTSLAGILAARAGKKSRLVAFEADQHRFRFLQQHLALNGVTADLHCAAAWWKNTTLYWPVSEGGMDAGMVAVSGWRPKIDYRGNATTFQKIPAKSIATTLEPLGKIDFLHIDIQGSEWELISKSVRFLNRHVKTMFVGTHSRKIEGDLIEFCNAKNWTLLREKPCQFHPAAKPPKLTGATYHDGGQFWLNNNL